jgi:glycolate oxidase FAD binding subunit
MHTPTSIEELQNAVRSLPQVKVLGGGSKPALSALANLSMSGLSGILDYQPSEYTFTALAGTPIREVQAELAKNGQFLPFDPPLVNAGATLGGTVAAGVSGPGRFRFGGVRDFLLGVRLVTGDGRIVFGGGKVVKNAAGFDIPKLMVGSLGQLGVLIELTFKVFPVPEESTTLLATFSDHRTALDALHRLSISQEELMCLDLEAPHTIAVRIAGLPDAQKSRTDRIRTIVQEASIETLHGENDHQYWSMAREFEWLPANHRLVRIPTTPSRISTIEEFVTSRGETVPRRYSVGGNVAWLGCPPDWKAADVNRLGQQSGTSAQPLIGEWDAELTVAMTGLPFLKRLQSVFDPGSKLGGGITTV